jgi:threonine/homoserine/homoserine lactone efflux protein
MPVGPIGILCIRHSLLRGMSYGFMCGLGAACADAVYGAIAGFGVTAVSHVMSAYRIWFQIFGALFLVYIGIKTFRAHAQEDYTAQGKASYLAIFLTTFLLTLTNPMTIIAFAGIYAALGIGVDDGGVAAALMVTFGVFLGSALWWFLLSGVSAMLGRRLQLKTASMFNKISGVIIIGFGALTFLTTIVRLFVG